MAGRKQARVVEIQDKDKNKQLVLRKLWVGEREKKPLSETTAIINKKLAKKKLSVNEEILKPHQKRIINKRDKVMKNARVNSRIPRVLYNKLPSDKSAAIREACEKYYG